MCNLNLNITHGDFYFASSGFGLWAKTQRGRPLSYRKMLYKIYGFYLSQALDSHNLMMGLGLKDFFWVQNLAKWDFSGSMKDSDFLWALHFSSAYRSTILRAQYTACVALWTLPIISVWLCFLPKPHLKLACFSIPEEMQLSMQLKHVQWVIFFGCTKKVGILLGR